MTQQDSSKISGRIYWTNFLVGVSLLVISTALGFVIKISTNQDRLNARMDLYDVKQNQIQMQINTQYDIYMKTLDGIQRDVKQNSADVIHLQDNKVDKPTQ